MSGPAAISPSQLATLPWIKPPPGVVPDFNSTETIAPIFTGVSITTLILAIGALGARFYVKFFIQKKLWIDDACLFIGLIFQCAYIGIVIQQMFPIGAGKHGWDLHLTAAIPFSNVAHYLAIISEPAQMFVSWGLLFFYIQLFSANKVVRISSYVTIALVFVVYVIPMILFEVYKSVTNQTNIQIQLWSNNTVGILNLITNLVIFSIPIFAVSKLQMSNSRKLGVIGIFATGLLAIIMSILGLVYRVDTAYMIDIPYSVISRWTVTTVEVNVGIICACLPLFPAIFRRKQLRSRLAPSKPTYGDRSRNPLNKGGSQTGLSSTGNDTYVELDEVDDNVKQHHGNAIFVTQEYHVSTENQRRPAQMV